MGCRKGSSAYSPVDLVYQVRETFDYPAPQDEAAGVKGIDEADGACGHGLGCSIHQSPCQGITGFGSLRNDFCCHRLDPTARHSKKESPCFWISPYRLFRAEGNRPASCQGLQTSSIPAGAQGAVEIDRHVT